MMKLKLYSVLCLLIFSQMSKADIVNPIEHYLQDRVVFIEGEELLLTGEFDLNADGKLDYIISHVGGDGSDGYGTNYVVYLSQMNGLYQTFGMPCWPDVFEGREGLLYKRVDNTVEVLCYMLYQYKGSAEINKFHGETMELAQVIEYDIEPTKNTEGHNSLRELASTFDKVIPIKEVNVSNDPSVRSEPKRFYEREGFHTKYGMYGRQDRFKDIFGLGNKIIEQSSGMEIAYFFGFDFFLVLFDEKTIDQLEVDLDHMKVFVIDPRTNALVKELGPDPVIWKNIPPKFYSNKDFMRQRAGILPTSVPTSSPVTEIKQNQSSQASAMKSTSSITAVQ